MTAAPDKAWFVYLVRAANGALYCGISDDPQRRFAQHQALIEGTLAVCFTQLL